MSKRWIVHLNLSYPSLLVVFKKKEGSTRLCCDYRKANVKTLSDRHPLPRIQSFLDSLGEDQYFTLLDQSSVPHQLHLNPQSPQLTTFNELHHAMEFLQMVQNSIWINKRTDYFSEVCGTLSRVLSRQICNPYLEDLVNFSKTFEKHWNHIKLLMQQLR